MWNLPNLLTLLRLALIPALIWALLTRDYDIALTLFVVSALSDLADGWIARRFNLLTRFGAVADPLADKLTMLTVTLLLASQQWLPWWIAVAVVTRDLVIVGGALAYHFLIGHVDMAPSRLSKFNTALEFVLLAAVLAVGAGVLDDGAWLPVLTWTVLATIVLSGMQYVLVWSRRARQQRRAAARQRAGDASVPSTTTDG